MTDAERILKELEIAKKIVAALVAETQVQRHRDINLQLSRKIVSLIRADGKHYTHTELYQILDDAKDYVDANLAYPPSEVSQAKL